MKRSLLLLSLFALLGATGPGKETGLVAYYSFDQCDARDETGGGSDGIIHGHVECFCGVEENGLLFDGQGAHLEFGGRVNRVFTTTDFTVSFYFRPLQYTTFPQSLLGKRTACDEQNMFDFRLDLNQQQMLVEVHETEHKFYPELSPRLDSTTWMHIALVRAGNRAYTYINGALRRESYRCSGVDLSNSTPLSFSHSPCIRHGRTLPFKGILDELRVYDRALEPDEILALYALHPVESAETDCYTYLPEKRSPALPFDAERAYLCAAY